MKLNFILILSTLLSIDSIEKIKQNFCINCKYIILNEISIQYSRCSLFPIIKNYNQDFLVTGEIIKPNIEYYPCSVAREFDDMCGKDGEMFKKMKKSKNTNN